MKDTMVSSEVQRTLVKSPPELWAELSDPAALARHLGALGEIRITRTEPESTVEWESENATGTISIKPCGWGTKVTLSVTRAIAEPEPEPLPVAEATPAIEPPAAIETNPATESLAFVVEADAPALPALEADAPAQPDTSEDTLQPEHKLGFFARLFRRKRRTSATAERTLSAATADPDNVPERQKPFLADSCAIAAICEAITLEAVSAADPFSTPVVRYVPPVEPTRTAGSRGKTAADIAAELRAAEEVAVEEVEAVLTAVLDRLGAAHHRPFSRA